MIGWHLRFYQTWAGSPVPNTFGVNQDWTRHQIVQTGHIGNFEPWTLVSSYMGAQNYDFASVLMAILNIITDTTHLSEGLTLLNAIQLAGLIFFPLVFLYWYWATNGIDLSARVAYLILLVSLFPTHQTIAKAAEGWFTELVATAVMLFILVFLAKAATSRRTLAVLVVVMFLMTNLYQTWIFFFLGLLGAIYLFDVVVGRLVSGAQTETLAVPTGLFLIAGSLFFISGEYLNGSFTRVLRASTQILLTTITESRIATDPALVQPTSSLFELNPRRIFKFLNALAAVGVVGLYAVTRIGAILRKPSTVLNDPYERVVLGGLCFFPFIIFVFFNYRGIGSAISRTRYIGIYFVILAAVLLFRSDNHRLRQSVTILLAVMVATAIPAFVLSGGLEPNHTVEEEQSIEWAGTYISQDSYVFSDAVMGPPLGYYNIRGISIIMVPHENWNNRTLAIYYLSNSTEAIQSVEATIDDSIILEDAPPLREYYVFLTSEPRSEGVSLLAQQTKPTNVDPRENFNTAHSVSKVYTSGETTLFYGTN